MGRRLLICDDDKDIVEMLEIVLDGEDLEIITETDSRQVMQLIGEVHPDLLLMDLWMPVMSGNQVLEQIRDYEATRMLPVVIMSAAQDGEQIAKQASADGYIPKPFDIEELIEKVHSFINSKAN